MKNVFFLAVVVITMSGCTQGDTDELESYFSEIRESGMSEGARSGIANVAVIAAGHTAFVFNKDEDSGRYFPSYMSKTCPNPELTEAEQDEISKQYKAERDNEIAKLRPLADFDSSGFVTTSEANEFRRLFEFGYLIRAIVQHDGSSIEAMASGANMQQGELRERVGAYNQLVERAAEVGIAGFDTLPME